MSNVPALKLAIEALALASECGGEADREVYDEAKQKLENLMSQVVAYDLAMDSAERSPEGEDYNQLLAILELA